MVLCVSSITSNPIEGFLKEEKPFCRCQGGVVEWESTGREIKSMYETGNNGE